jgi:hypothetical protein
MVERVAIDVPLLVLIRKRTRLRLGNFEVIGELLANFRGCM